MSLFKFKKATILACDFDPKSDEEWFMLHKPVYKEFTKFRHYQKLWCVEETEETEESPAIRKTYFLRIVSGYIKDGEFVREFDSMSAVSQTTNEIKIDNLCNRLKDYLIIHQNNGYTKDYDQYDSSGKAIVPKYHYNKKDDISKMQSAIQALKSSIVPPSSIP
jgi:cell fate (sporulation/competence/biofilm development) regulator YmcA (YheA/YmcA/DUF963 family)